MINHLKELRTNAGLTQQQLAELSGISRRTINRIERGLSVEPDLDTIFRIAAGLGARPEDVFELEPPGECTSCGKPWVVRKIGHGQYCPSCRLKLMYDVEQAVNQIFGEPLSFADLTRLFSR